MTVADREAEVLIAEALRRALPDALVLGEEATAADPTLLDRFRRRSTRSPSTRSTAPGTSSRAPRPRGDGRRAARRRGGAELDLAAPARVAYVAERGAGAWCNGERLTRPPLGETLRGVTSRRTWTGRALGTLRALDITWVCCGVDYPQLVEGAADYALYRRAKPWDHAPGSLLLTEAGGYVGIFGGALPTAGARRRGSSPRPTGRRTTSCTGSSTRCRGCDAGLTPTARERTSPATTGENRAMPPSDIRFYFDPVCPFAG